MVEVVEKADEVDCNCFSVAKEERKENFSKAHFRSVKVHISSQMTVHWIKNGAMKPGQYHRPHNSRKENKNGFSSNLKLTVP
jgi:hypothetical protein